MVIVEVGRKASAAGFTCLFLLLFSRSKVKGVTSVGVKTKHGGGSARTRTSDMQQNHRVAK